MQIVAQAYLDCVPLLCVPWGLRKSQRMACIDSRMLSTTVMKSTEVQTLGELRMRGILVCVYSLSPASI